MSIELDILETNHKIYNDDEITDCCICLEDLNEIKCHIIQCGCGNKICLNCAKECLKNSDKDPHCPNCRRGWDRAFQYEHFGSNWINKDYKKYRKNLLLEREKVRMPETQPLVEIELKKGELREKVKKLRELKKEYKNKLLNIQSEINTIQYKITTNNVDKDVEKKQFIKKCPNDDCRGFLSTAYKCELCKIFVCSKCHEIKGFEKTAEHECNPDTLKTIELMKKDTKPCPSCATPIFKIEGCDQMWCTQCKIAFSWRTGKKQNGIIHNPHYFEWMRANKNGNIQNPGAEVCVGIPRYSRYTQKTRILSKKLLNMANKNKLMNLLDTHNLPESQYIMNSTTMLEDKIIRFLSNIYRGITHNRHVVIQNLRNNVNGAIDNSDIRIKYLMKEIDEKQLAKLVTQRDNIREKKLAMLQVMELFHAICIETLNTINNCENFNNENIEKILDTLEYLYKTRDYCNKQFVKIANNYKMKVYYIKKTIDCDIKLKDYKFMKNVIKIN